MIYLYRIVFVFIWVVVLFSNAQTESSSPYKQWKYGPPKSADYFPIAVWLQNPKNASNYKKAGINLYVGLWKGPTEEQLTVLDEQGMQVICSQNKVGLAHRNDKTIVGWMHGDEPDNAQPVIDPDTGERTWGPPIKPSKIVEDYEKIKAKDPTRPVFLNLGQGVANDQWKGRGKWGKPEDYLTYVKGCDILSYDVYPVAGLRRTNGENFLWLVAKGVDRLIRWSEGQKIVWNVIECTHIGDAEAKATPHQVRSEVWMSIIRGSMGITYFVHEFEPKFNEDALLDDPEMLAAVTAINQQIHELAPVLNSPTLQDRVMVKSSNPDVPVDIMVKNHDGATWIFAVGMRNEATKAYFEINNLPSNGVVKVLGENRQIKLENNHFKDEFKPYDVHIYKIESQKN